MQSVLLLSIVTNRVSCSKVSFFFSQTCLGSLKKWITILFINDMIIFNLLFPQTLFHCLKVLKFPGGMYSLLEKVGEVNTLS